MSARDTVESNRIYGSGQHSHEVPLRDGLVVEIMDGQHSGTGVYWSESQGAYVFAEYGVGGTTSKTARCLLVRGQDVEILSHHGCSYGCDLDSPEGLALIGCDIDCDLSEWLTPGAAVLWDPKSDTP